MKILIIIAGVMLSLSGQVQATVIMAKSASFDDVGAAIASASKGDTVIVPAGTAVWNSTLQITTDITVLGAGIDQTFITNEVPVVNMAASLFVFATTPGFVRISGFTICGGTINTNGAAKGQINIQGNSQSFRVDNIKFLYPFDRDIWVRGSTCGVIDHCQFYTHKFTALMVWADTWNGGSMGDGSWATPVGWGTSKMVYIEDNQFTSDGSGGVIDSYYGGRFVFRHNSVINDSVQSHGTESGQGYRGVRAYEIYQNDFSYPSGYANAILLRSGTGVVWSNTASGYNYLCNVVDYRAEDSFIIWGGASGVNSWDVNSPTVFSSGTHTGADNSFALLDSSANWTVNQWVGYTLNNTTTGRFSEIVSNSGNMIYYLGSGYTTNMIFNNGDNYEIHSVVAALDQVGRSTGDLLLRNPSTGVPVTLNWLNEASEPLYAWGNTLNGADGLVHSKNAVIQEGRDFFNDTPKPGYVPFIYPHPLVTSGGTIPAAPTHLRAIPGP